MAAALMKAATPNTIKGLKDGTVNLVAGNCHQRNDTCFDWSKPGKYLPVPLPPPPKPDPAPAPPKAAYDSKGLNQTRIAQQQVGSTSVRIEHPATIESKGVAIASRMTEHASETMNGDHQAQATNFLSSSSSISEAAPTSSPSLGINSTSTPLEVFHDLPIATSPPIRRSILRYRWS